MTGSSSHKQQTTLGVRLALFVSTLIVIAFSCTGMVVFFSAHSTNVPVDLMNGTGETIEVYAQAYRNGHWQGSVEHFGQVRPGERRTVRSLPELTYEDEQHYFEIRSAQGALLCRWVVPRSDLLDELEGELLVDKNCPIESKTE